jgi:hypothetical protein
MVTVLAFVLNAFDSGRDTAMAQRPTPPVVVTIPQLQMEAGTAAQESEKTPKEGEAEVAPGPTQP